MMLGQPDQSHCIIHHKFYDGWDGCPDCRITEKLRCTHCGCVEQHRLQIRETIHRFLNFRRDDATDQAIVVDECYQVYDPDEAYTEEQELYCNNCHQTSALERGYDII
jgi:hypothetical protein